VTVKSHFAYGAVTRSGGPFQVLRLCHLPFVTRAQYVPDVSHSQRHMCNGVLPFLPAFLPEGRTRHTYGLGCSQFVRHYYGNAQDA